MAETYWTRSSEDRAAMAALLRPLVAATRPREFVGTEAAAAQVLAFVQCLRDCPRAVVAEAVTGLVERGLTWMPKPGELKAACAHLVAEKRRAAWLATLASDCPDCHGSRWREVSVNSVPRMTRCACWTAAMQAVDRVGQPLALPQSREDRDEVSA